MVKRGWTARLAAGRHDRLTTARATAIAGALVLAAVAIGAAQASDPGAVARAFFDALASGSADRFEAMAQERYAPAALARRTPAERRQLVERIRGDFGTLTLGGVRPVGDEQLTLDVTGSTGLAGRIELSIEAAPPHRITAVRVEVGGPPDDQAAKVPPPPITGCDAPGGSHRGARHLSRRTCRRGRLCRRRRDRARRQDRVSESRGPRRPRREGAGHARHPVQRGLDRQGLHEDGHRAARRGGPAGLHRHDRRAPARLPEPEGAERHRRSAAQPPGRDRELLRSGLRRRAQVRLRVERGLLPLRGASTARASIPARSATTATAATSSSGRSWSG